MLTAAGPSSTTNSTGRMKNATGTIMRMPSGEYIEVHAPVSPEERALLLSGERYQPLELETEPDENGVDPRVNPLQRMRARLSRAYFGEQIDKPTPEELEHGAHHAQELNEGYARQLESGTSDPTQSPDQQH